MSKISYINNYEIADKFVRNEITKVNSEIENINSEIENINSEKTIIIGDSYSLDRRPEIDITGWAVPLKELLGLSDEDCYILQDNGGGFTKEGSHGTWLNAITNLSVNDKNTIKNIIVCGGLNDCGKGKDVIKSAISDFINYCKTNFPNAQVYIGHIGNENDTSTSDGQLLRWYCFNNSIPAYKESTEYGAIYLNGVEYVMKDYNNYYDSSHPNQELCNILARSIYQSFKTGYVGVNYPEKDIEYICDFSDDTKLPFKESFNNNQLNLMNFPEWTSDITFTTPQTFSGGQNLIGKVNMNYYRGVYPNISLFDCLCILTLEDDSQVYINGSFEIYRYNNETNLVFNYNKPSTPYSVKKIRIRQFVKSISGDLC